MLKGGRALRHRFLGVLMKRFEDVSPPTHKHLAFMLFCADTLASLQFTLLEEPLWVVHNINRIVSVRSIYSFNTKLIIN